MILVDGYEIYLEIIQIGMGFYMYDVIIMKPQKARLVHHFVSIMAYIMILSENRIIWYGAVLNIEAYKLPLIIMQLLYYFEKSETIWYKVARGLRMVLWIVIKGGCTLLSISKSIMHGFPNVYSGYHRIMISSSVLITFYSLYIVYQDVEYFYRLARPLKKKEDENLSSVVKDSNMDKHLEMKSIERSASNGPNVSMTNLIENVQV